MTIKEMKEFQLRDYQEEQVEALMNQDNTCVQSPTGTGKSIVIYEGIRRKLLSGYKKIALIAPNQECVNNIYEYFSDSVATRCYTGEYPNVARPVLLSTYQSASKFIDIYKPDCVISDECHLALAETWIDVVKNVPEHHGLSATLSRLDGKGLNEHYSKIKISPSIDWFIQRKFLSDFRLKTIDCPLFEDSKGDNLGAQSTVFGTKPEIQKTVDVWMTECYNESTIIFCTGVTHGEELVKEFKKRGVTAVFVHSKMKDTKNRKVYFNLFKKGIIKVLINVDIFTQGVNAPNCLNVFLCRFTYSTARFIQMSGRLLRPLEDRIKGLYDLSGNSWYHGSLRTPFEWSLDGERYRESNNKTSLYYRCRNCELEIIHKKYITQNTYVSCTNCRCENYLNFVPKRKNKKDKFIGNLFTINEIENFDPDIYSDLVSMLLNKKMSITQKIANVIRFDISKEIKIKVLVSLQVPMSTIKIYLDD